MLKFLSRSAFFSKSNIQNSTRRPSTLNGTKYAFSKVRLIISGMTLGSNYKWNLKFIKLHLGCNYLHVFIGVACSYPLPFYGQSSTFLMERVRKCNGERWNEEGRGEHANTRSYFLLRTPRAFIVSRHNRKLE